MRLLEPEERPSYVSRFSNGVSTTISAPSVERFFSVTALARRGMAVRKYLTLVGDDRA